MSVDAEDALDLGDEYEYSSSVGPEGGESCPPYGQYPTDTRFRRPDYKFYKTIDDSAEFLQRVQPLPPPPPPPQPSHQPSHQQIRSPTRRPTTAYARWPPRNRDQQPPPREPEPGWRPIYPEPDLSTPRPSRPVTAPSIRSVARAASTCRNHCEQEEKKESALPETPVAMATQVREPTPQPVQSTPTPLSVVDFLEARPVVRQLPQPTSPPPQQPASASAARFYRPKTAPGRVATAMASGAAGGLQIQGHRMLPAERAKSAKSSGSRQSVGGGRGGGIGQLSEAYDRALAVHGWRMEVPGDPFGIKHHLIPERKPITVTVPEPTVKPLPPRMRRTNRFTFFHTTAPRVVMSFDIHPNFTSEQFAKARAALVKQGKWDYSYRDFSFIY